MFKLKDYGISVVKVASSNQREERLKMTFCSGAAIIYENVLWKWVDGLRQGEKSVLQEEVKEQESKM